MKKLLLILALFTISCGPKISVGKLSLRDPRLPIEARRWLADAEDEVAITKADVNDADRELQRLKRYRNEFNKENMFTQKGKSTKAGEDVAKFFDTYANLRVSFQKQQLNLMRKKHDLAKARLTQVRAETAIRHDLSVYEMEPILEAVSELKSQVAAIQLDFEKSAKQLDQATNDFWNKYYQFVKSGGKTNSFWEIRSAGGTI